MRFRSVAFLIALLAGLFLAPGGGSRLEAGQEVIWSGLIYATNTPNPKPPPRELARYAAQLTRVFGYNQFELINEQHRRIDERKERWLLPGREFSLRVSGERESDNEYLFRLELYGKDRLLVRTKARLGPGSPIAFRGPLYDRGQLIIVLLVK